MRGTYRLANIFGIDIEIHSPFFLLLIFFFMLFGLGGLFLIIGVFFFVTVHELCHSLAAAYFGIKVKRITLLPIGGISSMTEPPRKAYQELVISFAGPLSNILVLIIFYYPLLFLLGRDTLMYPLLVLTGQVKYTGGFNIFAHLYWINLILAAFNLLPAFPMDGGRILRALLSYRMSHREATNVAVRLGHIFALIFAYFGIVNGHIFLIIIAVFIYIAASSEGLQTTVIETIKNYSVQDILAGDFVHITAQTPISKVLELIFHTHQEDFPVMEDDGKLRGFITRREVMRNMHSSGGAVTAGEIMRTDIPAVKPTARLHVVQKLMRQHDTSAMPVEKNGRIIGLVTLNDINKVYVVASEGSGYV